MAGQNPGVSMDLFESYFRRADLDRDGKISGAEAVSFFQGSNLPKQVLAQIWMHADQSHTGFLSRQEFYNALKLVTVAQSKRELTPDIVKAALYGPASAKIPPPQINLPATPAPQFNSVTAAPTTQPRGVSPVTSRVVSVAASPTTQLRGIAPVPQSVSVPAAPALTTQLAGVAPVASQSVSVAAAPTAQLGGVTPAASQSVGFGGSLPPNTAMSPQYLSPQSIQSTRPPIPTSTATALRPPQGFFSPSFPRGGGSMGPSLPNSNISNDWLGGGAAGSSTGPTAELLNKAASPTMVSLSGKLQDPISTSSSATRDTKVLPGPGNGLVSDSVFGGDAFSATQSMSKQPPLAPTYAAGNTAVSSATVSKTGTPESSATTDPFAALRSNYTIPSTGGLAQQTQSLPKPNQQSSTQVPSSFSSGMAVGGGNSTSEHSQPWPKMTRSGIQKYAKVFMEVDTDRDGKISGEQARNLFLSWRLPREVLKQVWDLSDQDTDSMLSLREFCVALYLMERYREGCTLPSTLPSSIMLDDTLLSLAGPPVGSYGSSVWGPNPGLRTQQGFPGSQPLVHTVARPGMQTMLSQGDGQAMQLNQQNARGPLVENSHVNVLSNGELNSLDTKGQVAAETENKVENKENLVLDSKEKLEYYRTKMQDLVLYKSRCDNRLNEITERARADKHEAELLGKKYEEKYKQVAEIASKLTIEEASFRDIQERKLELHQAIIKMEQGGSADGILQVRADRIQSDIEELLKALAERCKKHGVEVKSKALIELPPGWQPGIPEIAAVWDEEWDKFEDEGFALDVAIPTNSKMVSHKNEHSSPTESFSPDLMSNADNSETTFTKSVNGLDTGSLYNHSEDESKSPHTSPARETSLESPSQDDSENIFRKSFEADSESHRGFDESTWGFDNIDDVDSVWGFGAKDLDNEKQAEKYFFGSGDFGASPTRKESPQADSSFQKNSRFSFEDSVPGSPLSRAGNSPQGFNTGAGDPFESFSRYDSFSTLDRVSPRQETLTRFDSINSTRSFDHSRNLSFDDSDPFGSSGPFKVSSDSHTPRKGSESWSGF